MSTCTAAYQSIRHPYHGHVPALWGMPSWVTGYGLKKTATTTSSKFLPRHLYTPYLILHVLVLEARLKSKWKYLWNEGLERTLNPESRTQPIREGVGRPSQHHKRNKTGGKFREATRRDLDAGGVAGLEEDIIVRLKCDGTYAETRFRLSPKRTSPFKSVAESVQSTAGSRSVRISGSNAG